MHGLRRKQKLTERENATCSLSGRLERDDGWRAIGLSYQWPLSQALEPGASQQAYLVLTGLSGKEERKSHVRRNGPAGRSGDGHKEVIVARPRMDGARQRARELCAREDAPKMEAPMKMEIKMKMDD